MRARQEKILKLVQEKKHISTTQLSGLLHYSNSTIRRDLRKLDDLKLIRRTSVGAMIVKEDYLEAPIKMKYETNKDKKKYIADIALDLIEDFSSLFLDSSTTSYYLASRLNEKNNLKVFTTNLYTADIIQQQAQNEVYLIGGKIVDGKTEDYKAIEILRSIYTDISFQSCRGFDFDFGASDLIETEALFKRTSHEYSNKTVLLVDSTKLHEKFLYQNLKSTDINYMVSDKGVNKNDIEKIQKIGIEFIN